MKDSIQKQNGHEGPSYRLTPGGGQANVVSAEIDGSNPSTNSLPSIPRRQSRDFTGATFGPWLTEVSRNQGLRDKTLSLYGTIRLFLFFPFTASCLEIRDALTLLFMGGRGADLSFPGSFLFRKIYVY